MLTACAASQRAPLAHKLRHGPRSRHGVGTRLAATQAAPVPSPSPNSITQQQQAQLAVVPRQDPSPGLSYDPERAEAYFGQHRLQVAARLAQLSWYTLSFAGVLINSQIDAAVLGVRGDARHLRPAAALQALLERAGPGLIKLAQTLAMRADVIGERYAASLAELQDNVKPFDSATAMAIVEAELGAPVDELFSEIEGPIASASLGQVYRARLASTGAQVAVKVQRPGAEASIAMDVHLLRQAVAAAQRAARLRRDLRPLVDEVGRSLYQELDFRTEASNTVAFGAAHASLPQITVPRVLAASQHVLVSEWVAGRSPNQLLAAAREGDEEATAALLAMVREGIQCSITQLLVTGVLHGDPHSGNLLMTNDGRLCYLDHGLLVRISDAHCAAMMSALIHLGLGQWGKLVRRAVLGQWGKLVDDLANLDLLKPETDRRELAIDLQHEFNDVLLEDGGSSGGGGGNASSSTEAGLLTASNSSGGGGGAGSEAAAMAAGVAAAAAAPPSSSGSLLLSDGPACDLSAQLPLLQLSSSSLSFSTLTRVLFRVAFRYKFLLPSYFPLIVRAMSSLEGVALAVDPNFKLVSAGMPVVLNHMLSDHRPASQALLRELLLTEGGALRVDATSEQLLQVWLAASKQAASTSKADPGSAADMARLLLEASHSPLRRVLMQGNPALTVAGLSPRLKQQLRGVAVDALSSRAAGAALAGQDAQARAMRRRLWLMFRASVPRVLRSPPRAVAALLSFTASIAMGVLARRLARAWGRLLVVLTMWRRQLSGSGGSSGADASPAAAPYPRQLLELAPA